MKRVNGLSSKRSAFLGIGFVMVLIVCAVLLAGLGGWGGLGGWFSPVKREASVPVASGDDANAGLGANTVAGETLTDGVVPTVDVLRFEMTVTAVMALMPTYTPYPGPQNTAKLTAWQRDQMYMDAARTVTAMQHIRPVGSPPPAAVPTQITPFPTQLAGAGVIIEYHFHMEDSNFIVNNVWREDFGTKSRDLYAGNAFAANSSKSRLDEPWTYHPIGYLFVVEYDKSENPMDVHREYRGAPVEVGPLHVVGAEGERIILQTDIGETFYFDVPTLQWMTDATSNRPYPTNTSVPTLVPTDTSVPSPTFTPRNTTVVDTPTPITTVAWETMTAKDESEMATSIALTQAPRETTIPAPAGP